MFKLNFRLWNPLLKVTALLVLLLIPILIIMMIFTPLAKKKEPTLTFKLGENFTLYDIESTVEQMRAEEEFKIYFYLIPEMHLRQAAVEVYNLMMTHPSKDKHYGLIKLLIPQVESRVAVLDQFGIQGGSFIPHKNHMAELRLLKSFLYEEFKLTLLGLCYKMLYDSSFQFNWSADYQEKASKIIKTTSVLPSETKEFLWHSI